VRLDEVLDDGQAKTGATFLAGAGLIGAVETLEDPVEMLVRDP